MHVKHITIYLFFLLITLFNLTSNICYAFKSIEPRTVKVASIHFAPIYNKKNENINRLLLLNEEAAANGAKIIVNTELATTGYSYFNRFDASKVAETVPGPTTNKFSKIAKKYGTYIILGLLETEPTTQNIFNTAIILGPDGKVRLKYHKQNNLLESSYNAISNSKYPTLDTKYGKLGIVICSDLFYPQIPRIAAINNVNILIVPANVAVNDELLKVLSFENNYSIIVSNRYGTETKGHKLIVFNQNSFTIPSPFEYDFNTGTQSAVIRNDSTILSSFKEHKDYICYGHIPISKFNTFPAKRRPKLYSLLGQDTLEPYTFKQLGLPKPTKTHVIAIGLKPDSKNDIAQDLQKIINNEQEKPKLIVVNAMNAGQSPLLINKIKQLSAQNDLDISVRFKTKDIPKSYFICNTGEIYEYNRTHKGVNEDIDEKNLSNEFVIFDRPYGRITMLHDVDLFPPETSLVMDKMGVDIIIVHADSKMEILPSVWKIRSNDLIHLIVVNNQGSEGIYEGGCWESVCYNEPNHKVTGSIDTNLVRSKKEPRHLDVTPLLTVSPND